MYQVIGKQNVDYENKDGKHVKGLKLFVAYEKKGVEGVCSESIYLSDSKLSQIGIDASTVKVDDMISVLYNRYGNVESISIQ